MYHLRPADRHATLGPKLKYKIVLNVNNNSFCVSILSKEKSVVSTGILGSPRRFMRGLEIFECRKSNWTAQGREYGTPHIRGTRASVQVEPSAKHMPKVINVQVKLCTRQQLSALLFRFWLQTGTSMLQLSCFQIASIWRYLRSMLYRELLWTALDFLQNEYHSSQHLDTAITAQIQSMNNSNA